LRFRKRKNIQSENKNESAWGYIVQEGTLNAPISNLIKGYEMEANSKKFC